MPRLMNPVRGASGTATFVLLAALLMAPGLALAQDVERRPWSELVVVVGHDIALSLPDGYVEGEALAVTHDALELDVRKTSNAGTYPKGHVTIPRSRVSVIRLRRGDNGAPRLASQTLGSAAIMGGLYGLGTRTGLRGNLRGVGVQLGAAAAGAVIGRRLDTRDVETLIRVIPEPGEKPATRRNGAEVAPAEPASSKESI